MKEQLGLVNGQFARMTMALHRIRKMPTRDPSPRVAGIG